MSASDGKRGRVKTERAVRKISENQLETGGGTTGMSRAEIEAAEGMFSGIMQMESGSVSGWHHHGTFETVVYVLSAALKVEFGSEGESVEAGPGEFLHIPGGTIHRESNPTSEDVKVVYVRTGVGTPLFNVAGPGSDE